VASQNNPFLLSSKNHKLSLPHPKEIFENLVILINLALLKVINQNSQIRFVIPAEAGIQI
jgi:hypothetical protein